MNYTDYAASPALCSDRNLSFGCVNEIGEEWPDTDDASYALRCVEAIIPYNGTASEDHDGSDHEDEPDHGAAGGSRKNTTGLSTGKSAAPISFLSGAILLLAGIAGVAGCM